MTDRLEELAHQRQALADEIARSRHELTRVAQHIGPPLRRAESLRQDLRYVRDNYALLLLPVALLVLLNPGRTVKLASLAWMAWQRFRDAEGLPGTRAVQALAAIAARRWSAR